MCHYTRTSAGQTTGYANVHILPRDRRQDVPLSTLLLSTDDKLCQCSHSFTRQVECRVITLFTFLRSTDDRLCHHSRSSAQQTTGCCATVHNPPLDRGQHALLILLLRSTGRRQSCTTVHTTTLDRRQSVSLFTFLCSTGRM